MGDYISEQEQKAKAYVDVMIQMELSYMNTNHPDFVGFNATAGGNGTVKRDTSLDNQVIRKGWLSIQASGVMSRAKECYFVLTASSLTWYKDDEVWREAVVACTCKAPSQIDVPASSPCLIHTHVPI